MIKAGEDRAEQLLTELRTERMDIVPTRVHSIVAKKSAVKEPSAGMVTYAMSRFVATKSCELEREKCTAVTGAPATRKAATHSSTQGDSKISKRERCLSDDKFQHTAQLRRNNVRMQRISQSKPAHGEGLTGIKHADLH